MPHSLAGWSLRHPLGVVMFTLSALVLGGFALGGLRIDLLPHIIYPDIRVRVLDPGVPARIMEDQVTRQLEEQLAITEGAIHVDSETSEGRSAVDLSFPYGYDIDRALQDASTRLDRAKRFLPDTIQPPIIYKRDPSQRPVAEYVVSSALRSPVELRTWADYDLAKWLLNLPGVAAVEVGGGLVREIQVQADQERLAAFGLSLADLARRLAAANRDTPGGRLTLAAGILDTRTAGRLPGLDALLRLPIPLPGDQGEPGLPLMELARVWDGHARARVRVRLNDVPAVKLSVQKQPEANTVAVVDAVEGQRARLQRDGLLPPGIRIQKVDDQAHYVRQALHNAAMAAFGGAILAMGVVWLFLGDLRRTLIIGSAIPIALAFTLSLMAMAGLSLNIMTLGGLALGVGMLVDGAIVMLENIQRHQRLDGGAEQATAEVTGAVVAATSTNLAAVLPFLFIGGLVGLLFRELIFTLGAAILAALVVALTLVPALAARVPARTPRGPRRWFEAFLEGLQEGYGRFLRRCLGPLGWLLTLAFVAGLIWSGWRFTEMHQAFLPEMDEGRVGISLTADPGVDLETMDRLSRRVETLVTRLPGVESRFTLVGGFIFGRSEYAAPNRTSIRVQLLPLDARGLSTRAWVARLRKELTAAAIPGLRVRTYVRGIRGIRLNRGDADLALRIRGPDLDTLARLGEALVQRLRGLKGLRGLEHSYQDQRLELTVRPDRERAAAYGIDAEQIGRALRLALEGREVTWLPDGGRRVGIRLRLAREAVDAPEELESLILFPTRGERRPVRLGEVARVALEPAPAHILRERQQRIVEVSARFTGARPRDEVLREAVARMRQMPLPDGYVAYEAGDLESLQEGRRLGGWLLGLALFLVLVAMAVQYESLRAPLVILLGVPFAAIGVAAALTWLDLPLSMPVWLGLIMLAGMVVNNAIVLVEFIQQGRARGLTLEAAIVEAGRLRLKPILMTTLTTLVGLLPLALAWGEGAEMLQPLAVTLLAGLGFSLLVSLVLIPILYRRLAGDAPAG